ncbi:unnamed protein product [Urochloa humidicola]
METTSSFQQEVKDKMKESSMLLKWDPNQVSEDHPTNFVFEDPSWYADSGASDHVTGDLEKLALRDKYNGNEQIHTASGAGSGHEEHSA